MSESVEWKVKKDGEGQNSESNDGRTKKVRRKERHILMDRWSVMIQFVFPGQSVKRPVESIITADPSVDRRRSLIVFFFFFFILSASVETWFLASIFTLCCENVLSRIQHSHCSGKERQMRCDHQNCIYESSRRERCVYREIEREREQLVWRPGERKSGCGTERGKKASQMGRRTKRKKEREAEGER